MEIPEVPMVFTKHTSCFVGPNANVEMRSDFVDYEAELVVVIGKEGDQILFGKYSGTEITIDGEEMLVMREDDITAIITN